MKKIKIFSAILALLMLVGLVGCSAPSENNTSDKELYDIGMELVKIQEEMIGSDAYKSIMGVHVSDETMEKMAEGVYDSPSAVYSITLADPDALLNLLTDTDQKYWQDLPEVLKEQLKLRVSFATIFTSISSKQGTDAIVIASQYMASKRIETLSLNGEKVFLYVFETGTPVAVSYKNGGASSYFLFLEEAGTLEDIQKVFEPYQCNVEKLNIK